MRLLFIQKDAVMVHPGIMSISSVLKHAGHQCDILIESLESDLVRAAADLEPDIIGISCTTGEHLWALKTARRLKSATAAPILLGGPHPTFYPEILDDHAIDMICLGEGENAILELADRIDGGGDVTEIPNLWVKRDNRIYKNDLKPLIQDLDTLPFMDRQLYKKYPALNAYEHSAPVTTGRGCPYDCTFCFNRTLREMYRQCKPYVRRRSAANVLEEIDEVRKASDVRRIMFLDDIFILDSKWVHEFLALYRERVNLPFSCLVRADLVNDDIVAALKRSGCFFARMGIESGNHQLRNLVLRKGITDHQIRLAASLIKKHGIKLQTNSILGIPGEDYGTALETLRINIDIRPDFAWCALMQPYPRTEIAEYALKHGFLPHNFTLDHLDFSYFFSTPMQIGDKSRVMNLQKLFAVCVKLPFLVPAVNKVVMMPPNSVLDLVFKISHVFGTLTTGEMDFSDLLRLGLTARRFYSR